MRLTSLPVEAILCLVVSFGLRGQTVAPASSKPATPPKIQEGQKKSALNKDAIEEYVRHLYVWGPQIQVKVGDPLPSEIPGFQQVVVVASAGGASQEELFYVSKDGRKIIRGVIYDVGKRSDVFPFDLFHILRRRANRYG